MGPSRRRSRRFWKMPFLYGSRGGLRRGKQAWRISALPVGWRFNCVANGKVLRRRGRLPGTSGVPAGGWAMPAVRLARRARPAYHLHDRARNEWFLTRSTAWRGAYLGPEFRSARHQQGASRRLVRVSPQWTARSCLTPLPGPLAGGPSDRLVSGPDGIRAPAHSATARSSAIPAVPGMQKNLNLKVKYRERASAPFRAHRSCARKRGGLVSISTSTRPTC